MSGSPWREDELHLLRENYSRLGPEGCRALLPGRTRQAITLRASLEGVQSPNRNWTASQVTLIIERYPAIGSVALAELIPDRTPHEIRIKAGALGVKRSPGSKRAKAAEKIVPVDLQALRVEFERLRVELGREKAYAVLQRQRAEAAEVRIARIREIADE